MKDKGDRGRAYRREKYERERAMRRERKVKGKRQARRDFRRQIREVV